MSASSKISCSASPKRLSAAPRSRCTSQCTSRQRKKREFDKQPPSEVLFRVTVDCATESVQRQLYEQLTAAGHVCRLQVL